MPAGRKRSVVVRERKKKEAGRKYAHCNGGMSMTLERAIRIAKKWSTGGVCTLTEGEAEEYHKLCLEALMQQKEGPVVGRWIPPEKV